MINSLNLIVAQTVTGKVKVLHAGLDRARAIEVFEDAATDASIQFLEHIREPAQERSARPAYAAAIAEEEAAAAAALAAAEEAAAEQALEDQARQNASSAAIELAEKHDLPLRGLSRSGSGGRIQFADVAAALGISVHDALKELETTPAGLVGLVGPTGEPGEPGHPGDPGPAGPADPA
jgi:pyruvate/2-oxoglutarate dehydrogenase complex dihydrolipoamide acyltransferase (E2) component